MSQISRRTVLLSALGVSAAGLAACGGSGSGGAGGSGGPGGTVSVGVIPIIDVAPLYLGVAKGIFSRHGLTVQPRPAQGGAAIVPAVLAGENQIGFSNVVSLLLARDKGAPVVSVCAGASATGDPAKDTNAIAVLTGSPLKSAKDLPGRKVAVNSLNNIGDTTVKQAVKKAGGDPAGVKFVEMPFSDMPTQLAAGTVDAVWVSEPFLSATLAGGARVLVDALHETRPGMQIAHYFTSTRTKQQNPQLVESFRVSMVEALGYAQAHPDEARNTLTTYTKIKPEVAAKVVLTRWPTEFDRESLTAVGDAARSFGTLSKAPDVAGLIG